MELFAAETYLQRREKLQSRVGAGLILLLGNEESPMNYKDNVYPFRQDSHFLYYFGLDKPHLAGIIDIDEGKTILFGDELTIDDIVWMGPQPSFGALAERVGVSQTAPYQELELTLAKAKKTDRNIHFLPPYRPENNIKLHQWLGIDLNDIKLSSSVALIKAVVDQVSLKTAEEITEMEKAVNISGQMHIAAMKSAKAGMKESALAGLVEGIAVAGGGWLAYPVILTINGQTLHNHYHGNTLRSGKLVLGDFGAETALHYAGDLTRTFPVDLTFNTRQKEIYQIVLDAEQSAIEGIRPGVRYLDIHIAAARNMAEGLKSLGLMKGDLDEAISQGAHALFFPHGLGHMIGLDVHDMEDLGEEYVGYTEELKRSPQFGLKSLRLARELQSGFALTRRARHLLYSRTHCPMGKGKQICRFY